MIFGDWGLVFPQAPAQQGTQIFYRGFLGLEERFTGKSYDAWAAGWRSRAPRQQAYELLEIECSY